MTTTPVLADSVSKRSPVRKPLVRALAVVAALGGAVVGIELCCGSKQTWPTDAALIETFGRYRREFDTLLARVDQHGPSHFTLPLVDGDRPPAWGIDGSGAEEFRRLMRAIPGLRRMNIVRGSAMSSCEFEFYCYFGLGAEQRKGIAHHSPEPSGLPIWPSTDVPHKVQWTEPEILRHVEGDWYVYSYYE